MGVRPLPRQAAGVSEDAAPRRVLASAFALGMAPARCRLVVEPVDAGDVPVDAEPAVGHASTAEVYSALLGRAVACDRRALSLVAGDEVYVGALVALDGRPWRPPEGTVLDAAALAAVRVEWRRVAVLPPVCGQCGDVECAVSRLGYAPGRCDDGRPSRGPSP